MYYTYVLLSEADRRLYIGATQDLRPRIEQHAAGRVGSTAYRRPLQLVYYEACLSPDDAYRRESYLNLVEAAPTSSSVWPARSLRLGTTSWNGTRRRALFRAAFVGELDDAVPPRAPG